MNNLEDISTKTLVLRLSELAKIINDCEIEQIQIVEELQKRYPNSKIEEQIQCKKLERKDKNVKRN